MTPRVKPQHLSMRGWVKQILSELDARRNACLEREQTGAEIARIAWAESRLQLLLRYCDSSNGSQEKALQLAAEAFLLIGEIESWSLPAAARTLQQRNPQKRRPKPMWQEAERIHAELFLAGMKAGAKSVFGKLPTELTKNVKFESFERQFYLKAKKWRKRLKAKQTGKT